MGRYFKRHLKLYWRETIGFTLFLAWVYCCLFGCGLASYDAAIIGLPTTYSLERIWMCVGFFELIGGLIGILISRLTLFADSLLDRPWCAAAAGLCAMGGTFFIWLDWIDRVYLNRVFYIPSGILTGMAIAWFTVVWARRLSSQDEAHLEFVVPFSFTMAFLLYFIVLLTKQSGVSVLILLIAMCATSAALTLHRYRRRWLTKNAEAGTVRERSGVRSFCLLAFASWIQIAFFRIISTPSIMGDRFSHYLIPFSSACILSLIMLLLCIRLSRYLNIALAYRWSLPLFILSYLPILIDYGNAQLRIIAYAINFLGMFGVQFGCWIGACKYIRRTGCSATMVFSRYAIGEGGGIVLGFFIGLSTVQNLDTNGVMIVSILLMGIIVFIAMAAGFNPNWVLSRTRPRESAAADEARVSTFDEFDLDLLFEQEATTLQHAYGLTNRETDVAALLLAGRSRPFIRDELVVSINTVSSHVRSIFSKCGVHSQQELMNLARGGGAVRTATPCEKPRQPR